MIDKIEAMIDSNIHLRGELHSIAWGHEVASPYSKVYPSKFYEAVADLRPFGFDAMLHYNQKRYGTHKVELFETGKKGMAEIQDTLERIVDCDPGDCRLGRIDLCADVRDVSLSWFREHTYVQWKQFICEHGKMQDCEYSEMGKKSFQTCYYGKKPSCLRIYDKVAERLAHYELWKRRELRAARRDWKDQVQAEGQDKVGPLLLPEFPTAQEWLAVELPDVKPEGPLPDLFPGASLPEQNLLHFPVVTRVENQFGGRVPGSLITMGEMKENVLDFNPFERMHLVSGNVIPPGLFDRDASGHDYRFGVLEWMAYTWARDNWRTLGGAQMWSMLNRDRHGKRYLKQMREFLPNDDSLGISEAELYDLYRGSISRQLAA